MGAKGTAAGGGEGGRRGGWMGAMGRKGKQDMAPSREHAGRSLHPTMRRSVRPFVAKSAAASISTWVLKYHLCTLRQVGDEKIVLSIFEQNHCRDLNTTHQ